jgi:thiol-disulfide isomerase/thioredoxin
MRTGYLRLAIVALALPLIGLHVAFKEHPDPQEVDRMRTEFKRPSEWQGKLAPSFELQMLDGSRFTLADHVGREIVVLNFFATWCGPCKEEMPEFAHFLAQHHDEPIVFVGIDAEEKRELVEEFVRNVSVPFSVGIDSEADILKKFGVDAYPTTVMIGADGRIQLYQTGGIANADVAFASVIGTSLELINRGHGISKENYLVAIESEHYPTSKAKAGEPSLSPHARRIAKAMDCPCGCSDNLQKCSCNTAKKAKTKLASLSLEGREDGDVMRELNREFCMKGMQ